MIIALDIECTGLDPSKDAIIEIAAVDILPDYSIDNHRSHLVCPPLPISPEASAVHQIIDADVAGKPPLREVIEAYSGACAIVCHNASYERSFLGDQLGPSRKTGQPPAWICTYKSALRVWPDFPSHNLGSLRYRLGMVTPFGIERSMLSPHRALSDAIVTAAIFVELLKHARWSQLAMWSNEPALHTIFTFGKYRGRKYAEIATEDSSYLDWIITKSELDADTKFSAQHALQQREAA